MKTKSGASTETAKRRLLKKHPEAHAVLDKFPGMEGWRVWTQVKLPPDHSLKGRWWEATLAFKTEGAAWRAAARDLA